jgi:hypothetical protein
MVAKPNSSGSSLSSIPRQQPEWLSAQRPNHTKVPQIYRQDSIGSHSFGHRDYRRIRQPKIEIPVFPDQRCAPPQIGQRYRLDRKRPLLDVLQKPRQSAAPQPDPQQVIDFAQNRLGQHEDIPRLFHRRA